MPILFDPKESIETVTKLALVVLSNLEDHLPALNELYIDLHRHPELSMQEQRTAGIVARHLRNAGYEVTESVGHTGVVGLLHNGVGPVVMLRGDMDALPIKEQTGLDYASNAIGTMPDGSSVPIMHACGHDVHMTCLIATAEILARKRDAWQGTLFICAQPAEEIGQGAETMLLDGLFTKFPRPDVCLGQHVLPLATGTVGHNSGTIMGASINVDVRLFGKGGHGSLPQVTIDPIIMASSLIMKLQTIRSREHAGDVPAVVTVGFVKAGVKHNVIPEEAHIGLNIRTQSSVVQQKIIDSIRRMAEAEAMAFRAFKPPEITTSDWVPLTNNNELVDQRIRAIHTALLGPEKVVELPTLMYSEDFSQFGLPGRHHYDGEPIPYCYWGFGGHSQELYDAAPGDNLMAKILNLPSNHQPTFAPVPKSTIRVGVTALTSAALAYLPCSGAT
ncbi:MAG TPA: amidohydrolase [Nitrososphaeraceae archaeon]|jgi:hippurate hydrolase